MRSAKKGPQANAVIPEGFPIKKLPPAAPFDVDEFMARLAAEFDAADFEDEMDAADLANTGTC